MHFAALARRVGLQLPRGKAPVLAAAAAAGPAMVQRIWTRRTSSTAVKAHMDSSEIRTVFNKLSPGVHVMPAMG